FDHGQRDGKVIVKKTPALLHRVAYSAGVENALGQQIGVHDSRRQHETASSDALRRAAAANLNVHMRESRVGRMKIHDVGVAQDAHIASRVQRRTESMREVLLPE